MVAIKKILNVSDYLNLGNLLLLQKKYKEASINYKKVLEIDSKNYPALSNLASVLHNLKKDTEAIIMFRKAILQNPAAFQSHYNLAIILQKMGRTNEAIDEFFKTIEFNPNLIDAYNGLAICLSNQGRKNQAINILKQALRLDSNNVGICYNLGNILREEGDFQEAEKYYKLATQNNPRYAEAFCNLGIVNYLTKNVQVAGNNFRKAINLKPYLPNSYYYLGLMAQDDGKLEEAADYFEKVIEIDSEFKPVYYILFFVYRRLCDWENSQRMEQCLNRIGFESPLTSLMRSEDPRKNLTVSKAWSEELKERISDIKFDFNNRKIKKSKIRLGYISGNFGDHPVGYMTSSILKNHNKNHFEIYSYSYGRNDRSVYRKMIEEQSDVFVDVNCMSDIQVAKKIHEDKIDILIDLTCYTERNRLSILAMRPAPIQITWAGLLGTSGASFFDYNIVDKIVVPYSEKDSYSEELIYLPDCFYLSKDVIDVKDKFQREDFGLPKDKFIFAVFVQAYKIEPVILGVWMNILKRVPNSVIWLWEQSPKASKNIRFFAKAHGVDPKRLVFSKTMSSDDYFIRLALADLAFDTLVYGGGATTYLSLFRGVPVITMYGKHMASRLTTSILNKANLSELSTNSLKAYEELAVELVNNPEKLLTIKNKLSLRDLKKTLLNTKKTVNDLEKAYQTAWRAYKNDKMPDDIIVED